MKRLMLVSYWLFCIAAIFLLSSFKEEWFIDGGEIKNACIAHRAFVVDDTRDVMVPLTIILLLPWLYLLKRTRLASLLVNTATLVLVIFALWRFWLRLAFC